MQGWPLSVPGRWRIMRSNGLSVKFIGLTSLFCQRQHSTPLQRVIKELPAFLRPCSMQLFHFGTIAALEPERQAGRIALPVVFRIQHPLAVGPVLDAVQMQQPIEHFCSAAVLFGDLRSRHQRIGIAQLRFIAAPARRLLMQQAKQRIPVKRLWMVRRTDCRMVQLAELLCHVLRDAVVFHIPLDRAPALILQPDTGHILVVAALDETILAHTREPLAKVAANMHLVIQITRPQRRGQRVHLLLPQCNDCRVEILISDNCSTDNTESIIASYALCAKGEETRLGVVKGPCVGAGVYINTANFDSALVNGVYYKKLIDFMVENAGFDRKQLNDLYINRLCLLGRHDVIKEKASGRRKINKKLLFQCTYKFPKAWVTLYPAFLIPSFICKPAMKAYRKRKGIADEIRVNRPE